MFLGVKDWSTIDEQIFKAAISESYRQTLSCEECLTQDHSISKCPFNIPLFKNSKGKNGASPDKERAQSPRRIEQIEQALANPEKSAKRPSEGLQLKFAFG